MAAPMIKKSVELGFLEQSEPFLLRSRFFPSKFGGKPAWLSLKNLPSQEELTCGVCGKPTTFLLQLSAPLESKRDDTFHRTLFIFVCKDPNCCRPNSSENIHAFRSQLRRKNDFYSFDPSPEKPVSSEKEVDATLYNKLCRVCGCVGAKTCSSCHSVNYCSKGHQKIDWKAYHKQECSSEIKENLQEKSYSCQFPEMDIVSEEEPSMATEGKVTEKNDEDKMKEYKDYLKSAKNSHLLEGKFTESELQEMASKETENDKQLKRFKERVNIEPEQVLRYERSGEPLWIAQSPKPESIPNCDCGSVRDFEFQVMPQLLSHMNVDNVGSSLDWGVLCVYTCSNSCEIGNNYKKEFIFKQDIS